jgi:hypothetical protein
MTAINRFLLVVALGLAAFIVWRVTDFFTGVPFEIKYEKKQIECLAAAARADAHGENPEDRAKAQEWILDVHLRNLAAEPATAPCDALQSALYLYPKGWTRARGFKGRWTFAIKWSLFYPGSPWDEAYKRTLDALKRGPDRSRCATRYIRIVKGYSSFTNEEEAAAELSRMVQVGKMKIDPKQPPNLKTKFLCPA